LVERDLRAEAEVRRGQGLFRIVARALTDTEFAAPPAVGRVHPWQVPDAAIETGMTRERRGRGRGGEGEKGRASEGEAKRARANERESERARE
jgi:hypothetical protein